MAVLSMSCAVITAQCDVLNQLIFLIETAAVVYDWILTLPDETRLIWKGKISGAKVLFLLNRYLFIACYVTGVLADQFDGAQDTVSIQVEIHIYTG